MNIRSYPKSHEISHHNKHKTLRNSDNKFHIVKSDVTIINIYMHLTLPIVLNKCLRQLIFSDKATYKLKLDLSKNMESLTSYSVLTQYLVLTKKMLYIELYQYSNSSIKLTKRLGFVKLGWGYNKPIVLTKYLTHLTIQSFPAESFDLNKSLIRLELLVEGYMHPLILTKRLKYLTIGLDCESRIYFTDELHTLSMGKYDLIKAKDYLTNGIGRVQNYYAHVGINYAHIVKTWTNMHEIHKDIDGMQVIEDCRFV